MTNNLPEPDDAPWLNLTPQEVEALRYNKQELTKYGREKIRALMLKSQMTETIQQTKEDIAILQEKLQKLEELQRTKSPAEEAYKGVYGCYPPTTPSVSNSEDERWSNFQKGYNASKEDCKVEEPKPMDDAIDRLLEKYKSQKLWNMVRNELGYSIDCCDEIVDLVEKWLPKEQSAEGSQNAFAIDATEGFNHCLNKIKGTLR